VPTEDETRRELFDLLESGIGSRGAALLMTYLPPTGWADLATKQDLRVLDSDLRALGSELRGEMAELRAELKGEMKAQLPKLIAANIASMVGVAGLVLAAGAVA